MCKYHYLRAFQRCYPIYFRQVVPWCPVVLRPRRVLFSRSQTERTPAAQPAGQAIASLFSYPYALVSIKVGRVYHNPLQIATAYICELSQILNFAHHFYTDAAEVLTDD